MRLLKAVVIVLAVLILLAFMALIAGMVLKGQKMAAGGGDAALAPAEISAALPEGARVAGMELDGERLAVMVDSGGGRQIMVFDLRRKRLEARIMLGRARDGR